MSGSYVLRATLWRHSGPAGWHFVTLPPEVADEIAERHAGDHRPFGSLGVRATLGGSSWTTSLFADGKAASYLLPVKAEVRRREGVGDGDEVEVRLEVVPG